MNGYLRGFALPYCEQFVAIDASAYRRPELFLRWRDATLVCLQAKLHSWLRTHRDASCEQLKHAAIDMHADCYLNARPSVCALPLLDLARIARVDLAGFTTKDGFYQLLDVIDGCIHQWLAR